MVKNKWNVFMSSACILICVLGSTLFAGSVAYRLLPGSTLTDECTICDRLPFVIPIEGGFILELKEAHPLYDSYAVRNLTFRGEWFDQAYTGRLDGEYRVGGEVALQQEMKLTGRIREINNIELSSGNVAVKEFWPWIVIDVLQVQPDPYAEPWQKYDLHLVAVPWPGELAFSTENGCTSADPSLGKISDGDLLSPGGKIVRRNGNLLGKLGIMPIVPDVGLDAILRPTPKAWISGGFFPCDFWFSIERDVVSESLGALHHGDLVSDRGAIIKTNSDLLSSFAPALPVPDVGLDAICESPEGVLLFSTEEDFFSEKLGRTLGHGDLLNSDGTIFKTSEELLARFHPILPVPKEFVFGLDAAYVWPNGEVWFSIENGFTDVELGPIGEGDLLSSVGRIVMTNRQLLREFKPIEDLADFGLDAIEFIIPQPLGDLDYDCDVQLDDFAEFAAWWLRKDCLECGGADFSGDGLVEIDDLVIFAEHWLMDFDGPKVWQWWGGSTDTSPPADPVTSVFSMEVRGSFIYLKDLVKANCCVKGMDLQLEVEGTRIHAIQEEIRGAPCICLTNYPMTAVIGPFAPGTYWFDLNRHTDAGCRLIEMKKVVIKPWMEYKVLPCTLDEAPPPADGLRFSVAVKDRMIELHDRILANCCATNIRLSVDVVGTEITITETETAENPCWCLCGYPTTATTGPFKPGPYTVAVVQNDASGSRVIGTTNITIE